MTYAKWNRCGGLLAAAGMALLLIAAPAQAQAPDAAERCTPDVMRLCSEYVPDEGRIVRCLKAKRARLSRSCLTALQPSAKTKVASSKNSSKKKHR